MPTQEERLTALEQTFATLRKENAIHIREVDENTTIMLGVIRDQGRDIKRIVQRLETIDERLHTLEQRFDTSNVSIPWSKVSMPWSNISIL